MIVDVKVLLGLKYCPWHDVYQKQISCTWKVYIGPYWKCGFLHRVLITRTCPWMCLVQPLWISFTTMEINWLLCDSSYPITMNWSIVRFWTRSNRWIYVALQINVILRYWCYLLSNVHMVCLTYVIKILSLQEANLN